jgi:hypothetical protein
VLPDAPIVRQPESPVPSPVRDPDGAGKNRPFIISGIAEAQAGVDGSVPMFEMQHSAARVQSANWTLHYGRRGNGNSEKKTPGCLDDDGGQFSGILGKSKSRRRWFNSYSGSWFQAPSYLEAF